MKTRILYCLLTTITFTGLSILFSLQQSYAQSPTSSPAFEETTGIPSSDEGAKLPEALDTPTTSPTPSPDSPTPETTSPALEEATDIPSSDNEAEPPEALGTPTTSPITPNVTPPNPEDVFDFDFLGFNETTLKGPSGSTNFFFGVPADWELEEGTQLQLDFSTFFDYLGLQPDSADNSTLTSGGSLNVLFNDEPLITLPLDEVGEQSVTIPIPTSALTPTRDDRRHKLAINLETGLSCGSDLQTNITIHPTSHFVLPHHLVTPSVDLRLLPWPIQQRSFLPDFTTIVTPNQPTEIEMQAALAVAAGLGKMAPDINLSLIPIGQLTAATREANHLIFVGKGEDFPLLKDVDLPAPVGEAGFEAFGAFPEDGIIQIAISPWNSSRAILIIGGESDIGLTKASQAISVGKFLTSGRPDLALIAEVQSEDPLGSTAIIDQSLAELGYSSIRANNTGSNTIEYEFEIPAGYVGETDAYLDLIFNNSALLDFEQSGGLVSINDQAIGSLRLSDETISLTTTRLTIPHSALRTGINKLTVQASLKPQAACYDSRLDAVWLTVWPESMLHLPLKQVNEEIRALFDLVDYPEPFESNSTLNNVAFVLGVDDLMAWNVATQIAYDLGNRAKPAMAGFAVAYGDNVSESIRQNHHLLIVGRPSKIPLLTELSEDLPAPFEPGSDIPLERGMRVRSRILPDTSFGYLESISAPWNRNWSILTVLGSTDQGLGWAGAALTTNQLRNQLNGSLAIIDNEHISVGDLELAPPMVQNPEQELTVEDTVDEGAVSEEVIQLEPVASATAELVISDSVILAAQMSEISGPPDAGRPDWLLPALMASISLMVIIVGIVMFSAWRQHRLTED